MKKIGFTRMLERVTKADFSFVGGKGANLGEMLKAGLPVPGGFVVLTTAYNKYVEANSLNIKINDLLSKVDVDNPKELEEAAQNIQDLFAKGSMPTAIQEEISGIYKLMGRPEVAVRSSATAEDLPGTSFAGQYNTYLNVQGTKELLKYVKLCWASLWNYRALSYRIKQGIDNNNLAHGVVIQKLINAEKSGILFTANPTNGRRDQILLNSSWGIGEAIVGGEVTPDQWVIDKNNGRWVEERVADKEIMTIRKDKGIEFIPVPEDKRKELSLNSAEVAELLQLALAVEDYFGSPQDIEWSYYQGKFYLVQTRPITSLYPLPEPRTNKKGLRVFINVGLYSQAMKEPFTPMGESTVRAMIKNMIEQLGIKTDKHNQFWWYQIVGGRIFFDITDFMRTEKSWDKFKKEDSNDKDPVTTKALLQLVERNKDEIINPKEAVSLLGMVSPTFVKFLLGAVIKFSYGIFSPAAARNKALALGEATVDMFKEAKATLKTKEDKLAFIESKMGNVFINCASLLFYVTVSSTYIDKVKVILNKYLGDTSDLNYVEKSVPYSVTTEMGMEILKIAKIYSEKGARPRANDPEIVKFMEKYGHRSSIELDVGIPTWQEEPQYVLDLINTYIDNDNYQEGIDRFYRGQQEAVEAIARIKLKLEEAGQKGKAKKVEKMLKAFREMFGIRELSKSVITQTLSIVREMLLEVGQELQYAGRLQKKEDVFFVTIKDIRSGQDLKEVAAANRDRFNRDQHRVAPRLMTSTGESIYSAFEQHGENTLVGLPVSPGVYEGRVRVLTSPEEGHRLAKGDILVTSGTNPAWTPLFLKLGALIMETGGPISHGSVVAREYGVPAVAGVAGATAKLQDGQLVRINGESGTVEVVEVCY